MENCQILQPSENSSFPVYKLRIITQTIPNITGKHVHAEQNNI